MELLILFGLAAALGWGSGDFLGGLQARSLPALAVVLWSQFSGLLVLLLVLLVVGQSLALGGVLGGIVAGLCYGAAIVALYRGLAIGVMSIVAPISATGAVIPVLVSILMGEVPSVVAAVGLGAAFVGAVLVSLQVRETTRVSDRMLRPALILAFCTALGLGVYIVILDQATSMVSGGLSPLWVIVGARIGSVAMVLTVAALGSWSASWPGRRIGLVAAAGLLDTAGNSMLAYATAQGNLGIAAVLSSLYPVVTVLLGLTVLKERLTLVQGVGVSLALLGIILIAAG